MLDCQRFSINLTESAGDRKIWLVRDLILTWQISAHFVGEMNLGIFVALLFYGWEMIWDFGGKDETKFLRIFSKPSAINRIAVLHLVSSFNIYIMHHDITVVRSVRHQLIVMWSNEGRRKLSFGALPNMLDPENFDQRCSINMIGRRKLSRIVLLQEFAVYWHHKWKYT